MADGAFPAPARRRSTQAPIGINASPMTNNPGRRRKKTIPMYGLVCSPNRSARNTTRNSTALMVVNTMPATEMGLRIKRTFPAMRLSLLEGGEICDQRVDLVLGQRVRLHARLARGVGLRRHPLRVSDPRADVVGW